MKGEKAALCRRRTFMHNKQCRVVIDLSDFEIREFSSTLTFNFTLLLIKPLYRQLVLVTEMDRFD